MSEPTMQEYIESEWRAGRLTRPDQALMQLANDTESFLRRHPIQNNFDCAAHGPTQAYFRNDRADATRPGSVLGTLHQHTTESFTVECVSGVNANGVGFLVHGVYTGPSSADPDWYVLDGGGPPFMLTAKLTGCTFVATDGPHGTTRVTHLQPDGESGLDLNRRMTGPGQAAYGRLRYDIDSRSINIVGTRSGSRWSIWAQKIDKHAASPSIRSVHRIWPL